MTWILTSSLDEFRAEAGDFLAAHPAENTVLLTLVDRLAKLGLNAFGPESPRFGWWRPGPEALVAGAFLQTPPYPPRLGRMPTEAGAELAAALHADGVELTGIAGGEAPTWAFAEVWQKAAGCGATVRVNERLYRLGELTGPTPAPEGRARVATTADRELLIAWFDAFMAEINHPSPDLAAVVDRRTADGDLHIWEVDGRAVSLAGVSPVIAGMSRVGPVFTPPELRGRGYAGGVVAAGSAHALAQGADEVLLYTDLANPTSNSIYQKLGYRPVADCVTLDF